MDPEPYDHIPVASFDNPLGLVQVGCSSELHDQGGIDALLSMFSENEKLHPKQIVRVYSLANRDFEMAMECLLEVPSIESILKLCNAYSFKTSVQTRSMLIMTIFGLIRLVFTNHVEQMRVIQFVSPLVISLQLTPEGFEDRCSRK